MGGCSQAVEGRGLQAGGTLSVAVEGDGGEEVRTLAWVTSCHECGEKQVRR